MTVNPPSATPTTVTPVQAESYVPTVGEDALDELKELQIAYGRKIMRSAMFTTLKANEMAVTPQTIRRIARRRPPAIADIFLAVGPFLAGLAVPLAIQYQSRNLVFSLLVCLALLGVAVIVMAVSLKLRGQPD